MKVIFKKETDPSWVTAGIIEKQSNDGCFSPNEISTHLSIDPHDAIISVDGLYERGLALRIDDDWSAPVTGKERWCLIKPSLTLNKEYEILAICGDGYLILNDSCTDHYGNDPSIFHKSCFEIADSREPSFWQCQIDEDGDRYCCLPSWSSVGFFEDYHDGLNEVKKQFWADLESYFPETWKECSEQPLNPSE